MQSNNPKTRPNNSNSKKKTDIDKEIVQEKIAFFENHVLELNQQIELYDTFCKHALDYAKILKAGKVTTSMIRKIYTRILNASKVEEIKLLRPHFAYTSGRNEKNEVLKGFMDLLDSLAKKMELGKNEQLDNLKQFMEAIVAYRKYVGDDK